MSKRRFPPAEGLFPAPVVLVSSRNGCAPKANIITIAWCGIVCSNPPLISISIRPSRCSHGIILRAGDFVVNIPSEAQMEKADICGFKSGKNVDKFKLCAFTALPASKVSSPMIKECPVNIECLLKTNLQLGSHDIFIGEVRAIHVDRDILDKSGRIDYARAKPFVYNQGEYWSLGKKIGFYGCSRK